MEERFSVIFQISEIEKINHQKTGVQEELKVKNVELKIEKYEINKFEN